MKQGNAIYFAYGSNLHQHQMKKRCPGSVPLMRVKLEDYQLVFNRVATIEPASGKTVWGALYQVTPTDIRELDKYEGYPQLYRKETVMLEDDQGQFHEAFVYLLNREGQQPPPEHYFKTIEAGFNHWKLPTAPLDDAYDRSFVERINDKKGE